MTLLRRAAPVAAVAVVLLGACSAESGEPQGLDATTSAAADPTSEPTTPAPTPSPTPTTPAEPAPTFTQPFVPGEPSVIELPESLPVEGADDLSGEERAVVDALGHAMAAWDAMLFGADLERAGLDKWFGGDLLTSLTNHSLESVIKQRVTVGSPTRVVLQEASVSSDEATVSACFYTEDWTEYVRGEPGEPVEPVEGYRLTADAADDAWKFTKADSVDLRC